MANPSYLLVSADTIDLPNSRTLITGFGLTTIDAGPGSSFNITPDGTLQALASLYSGATGIIVNNGDGVVSIISLTSSSALTASGGNTIGITNPGGVGGNPVLAVYNDTSIQHVNVLYNSQPSIVSTRSSLNFIPGLGASITVADDLNGPTNFSGQTNITIGLNPASSAPTTATYVTSTNEASILPNSVKLIGGNNITLTEGTNTLTINASSSAGATVITYFNQAIDQTFAAVATTIGPGAAAYFTFTTPDALLLNLLQNGDSGSGYLLVQANISYTLAASSALSATLPFSITFDLTTDANPLSPPLSGSTTWYYNSSVITTPQFNAFKSLNSIADPGATRLQIWIQNPDPVNSMSLQNFSNSVVVAYLPNGYS